MYGAPILLDVNIVVFLAMAFSGAEGFTIRAEDLLAWGANFGPYIHGLGVFRLILCQFVHAGIIHLANNLYGLFLAAVFLTPVIANARLILSYLVCGLGGSITSFMVHPMTVSVGASGAVMGLCGVLLTLLLLNDQRIADGKKMILLIIAPMVGLTLLLGAASRGIDNAAHIGGFLTGVALGLLIFLFGLGEARKTTQPRSSRRLRAPSRDEY